MREHADRIEAMEGLSTGEPADSHRRPLCKKDFEIAMTMARPHLQQQTKNVKVDEDTALPAQHPPSSIVFQSDAIFQFLLAMQQGTFAPARRGVPASGRVPNNAPDNAPDVE